MKKCCIVILLFQMFCIGCMKSNFLDPTDEIEIKTSDGLEKETKQIIDKITE